MKLSECKLGEIVICHGHQRIGHIVGLTHQYLFEAAGDRGQVVPEVLFAGEKRPVAIHHNNISKYKE